MLFDSSLRKELARSFGATFVVLTTIIMTIMLIRTLSMANRGTVNPSEVMLVMGLTALGHLPTILTLSLFIAIVGTLGRMYGDSEMVIWFASGRGLAGFLKPILRFSGPILVAIAVLALVIWPWANRQTLELKARYEKRSDLERVAPGQFQESTGGKRVFFIDKDSPDTKTGNNVFISSIEKGHESVVTATTGRIEWVGGLRYLMLNNGQHIDRNLTTQEMRVSEFKTYAIRVDEANVPTGTLAARAQNTWALLGDPVPNNLSELSWRFGLTLAALNFIILSLAVSAVRPRSGRASNLVFALLTFVVYYNLLSIGQNWIASGRVQALPFMLWLHGGALALGLAWLTLRHRHETLPGLLNPRRWLPRRGAWA